MQLDGQAHAVGFRATDVAGNTSTPHVLQVAAAPSQGPAPVAKALPKVTGKAVVGTTLAASTGSWNVTGLTYARQWLRDGVPIAGATTNRYLLGADDSATGSPCRSRPPGPAARLE